MLFDARLPSVAYFPRLKADSHSSSMAPGVPADSSTNDWSSRLPVVMHYDDQAVSHPGGMSLCGVPPGGMSLCHKKSLSLEAIGVVLVDGRPEGRSLPDARCLVLGTVCVEHPKQSLEELRRFMCNDLPCLLPANFSFLTKQGFPVQKQNENKLNASHLIRENNCICIKKEFEKPRVGVVTASGDPVGFVFTDINVNIKQLREIILQQLKSSQHLRVEFKFVDRNLWPVMTSQESALSLGDIIMGQIVCIENTDKPYYIPTENTRPTSLVYSTGGTSGQCLLPSPTQESIESEPVKRKKSLKFTRPETSSSMKSRKESSEKMSRLGKNLIRPILISYVRAEAAQYALDLKQELVSMGFSVYLDVHEIKTGSDWQDALNFAVTNCFLFVPLITPNYGKTQWTNREIKLADVLHKIIIPVNFMEHWPPPCLAIQFASTQYIPWKIQDSDHVKEPEKPSDSKHWDPVYIKKVSKQIAECYKDHFFKQPKRTPSSKEVLPAACRPVLAPREDVYIMKEETLEPSKQSQSIVISAHPRQRYLAQDLKVMFERAGHEVWCSVDLLDYQMNLGSEDTTVTDPITPRNLPTIQEGDVFFSQNECLDMFNSVGDKKSLSLSKEQEQYGKRPLSRLMSQFSDISQPSTLSPEKLDHLRTFQQKVDQAAVVIVLVSDAYTKSQFSHQQVFYCEHRKQVVLVKCDMAPIPKWFRLLMGNDMIPKVNNSQFECALKTRIERAINPLSSETPKDATAEAKINYLVDFLKRNMPLQDMCVYVAGSSKLQTQRAEEICKAIGTELAKVERVSLVTGGFFGAADITAKTFCEHRAKYTEYQSVENIEEMSVVHILPNHDSQDLTAKARQNPDGSFDAIPYGKNIFLGDSVKERETVVARLLDTCIVIEGGPGVVHEVEEFIWNDHFVIPIMSTGGAAGGMYGVPVRIFEVPPGVDDTDWAVLSDKDATPEAVAKAVVNIMISLKKALSSSPTNTLQKSAAIVKRKSRKKLKSRKMQQQEVEEINLVPAPTTKKIPLSAMRNVYEREASEISQSSSSIGEPSQARKKKWWRRFLDRLKKKN